MSAIKNMYGKTKLSEDKKAELKAALGERYPQYAESRTYKTEGIRMNDTKINGNSGQVKVSRKWRNGAIIAAVVMVLFMICAIGLILWADSIDPAPKGVLILMVAIFGSIIVGVLIALGQRIKELNGGELDEASKY